MDFDCTSLSNVSVSQGEFRVSTDPSVVFSTILGSCVSVCLFDVDRGVGGLNHFLLPGKSTNDGGERYGVNAMELLINELLKRGASRNKLVGKLFGGGSMSQNFDQIGTSNAQFAQKYLQDEGIQCASSSLGGTLARRIRFHPTSGSVKHYRVPKNAVVEPLPEQTMSARSSSADITLF